QHHASIDTFFREHLVDDRVTGPGRGDDDVPFGEERAPRRRRSDAWMACSSQTDEVLLEQCLLVKTGFERRHKTDGEIDVTRLEAAAAGLGNLLRLDAQVRCHPG